MFNNCKKYHTSWIDEVQFVDLAEVFALGTLEPLLVLALLLELRLWHQVMSGKLLFR